MKKMDIPWFIIPVVLIATGTIWGGIAANKDQKKITANQKTIKELNDVIAANVELIKRANEEIVKATGRTSGLVEKIDIAQEQLGNLASETADVAGKNLDIAEVIQRFTKGSDKPLMIKFNSFKNEKDLNLSTYLDDDSPLYNVEILVKEFGVTEKERYNLVKDKNLKVSQLDDYNYFNSFTFPHILPKTKWNLGKLKNKTDKEWRRFEIQITTKTDIYLQKTYAYQFRGIWAIQSELYNSKGELIEEDKSSIITPELINKYEGSEKVIVDGNNNTFLFGAKEIPALNEEILNDQIAKIRVLSKDDVYMRVDSLISELALLQSKYYSESEKIHHTVTNKMMAVDTMELDENEKWRMRENLWENSAKEKSLLRKKLDDEYYKSFWLEAVSLKDFLFLNIKDYFGKRPKSMAEDKYELWISEPKDRERMNRYYSLSPGGNLQQIIGDLRDLMDINKKED